VAGGLASAAAVAGTCGTTGGATGDARSAERGEPPGRPALSEGAIPAPMRRPPGGDNARAQATISGGPAGGLVVAAPAAPRACGDGLLLVALLHDHHEHQHFLLIEAAGVRLGDALDRREDPVERGEDLVVAGAGRDGGASADLGKGSGVDGLETLGGL